MRTQLKSIFIVGFLFVSQLVASEAPPRFMVKQNPNAFVDYARERELLSSDEINDLLDRGLLLESQNTLTQTLAEGGSALFPHTHIRSCGDQTAAVAQGCLAACKKNR